MKLYTGVVSWGTDLNEEIDVKADSQLEARRKVQEELDQNYNPGGKIERIIGPRFGLFY